MQHLDWIAGTVIFVLGLAFLFALVPQFLPKPDQSPSESQFQESLDGFLDEIQFRGISLQNSCPATADCNYSYPVLLDYNAKKFPHFSRPYASDANRVFSFLRPGEAGFLYLFPRSRLTADNNATDLNLALTRNPDGTFRVQTSSLDATLSSTRLSLDYLDSNSHDLNLFYPAKSISVWKDSNAFLLLQDATTNFGLYFFSNAPEFWVFLPADANLDAETLQRTWQADSNVGINRNEVWWDSNAQDSETWNYRLPLTVHAQTAQRENLLAKVDVNFARIFQDLGKSNSLTLNSDSLRPVQYWDGNYFDANSGDGIDSVPFKFTYSDTNFMATLVFQVPGILPQNQAAFFHLYFDSNLNPKTAPTQATLAYQDPSPPVFISTGQAQDNNAFSRDKNASQVFLSSPNTLILHAYNQQSPRVQGLSQDLNKECLFSFDTNVSITCPHPALLKFAFRPLDQNRTWLQDPVLSWSPLEFAKATTPVSILGFSSAEIFVRFTNSSRTLSNKSSERRPIQFARTQGVLLVKSDGNAELGQLLVQIPRVQ